MLTHHRNHRKVEQKVKGGVTALNGNHFRAMEHHLPYGITQCYLPLDTNECSLP